MSNHLCGYSTWVLWSYFILSLICRNHEDHSNELFLIFFFWIMNYPQWLIENFTQSHKHTLHFRNFKDFKPIYIFQIKNYYPGKGNSPITFKKSSVLMCLLQGQEHNEAKEIQRHLAPGAGVGLRTGKKNLTPDSRPWLAWSLSWTEAFFMTPRSKSLQKCSLLSGPR